MRNFKFIYMKEYIKNLMTFIFISILYLGCSEKKIEPNQLSTNSKQKTEPPLGYFPSESEANPMYDNLGTGLYKGTLVAKVNSDSIGNFSNNLYKNYFYNQKEVSGVIKIDLFNSNPEKAFAIIWLNGFRDTLYPKKNENGLPLDSYGNIMDSNSEIIYCYMESNKEIEKRKSQFSFESRSNLIKFTRFNIPGMKVTADCKKEKSDEQILIFNGLYEGKCTGNISITNPNGTFNMVIPLKPYYQNGLPTNENRDGFVQYYKSPNSNKTDDIELNIAYLYFNNVFKGFGITSGDPISVSSDKSNENTINGFYKLDVLDIKGDWSVLKSSLSNNGYSCNGTWYGSRVY